MTDIKMVPIGALLHHPDNPRKDLGDLTELTESIRINGVLQNLTVVHALHYMTDEEWRADTKLFEECQTEELRQRLNTRQYISPNEYWVVIGNRRLEAAKMAGLTELPCVISDMDHKTQVATMLEENMQRTDLTIYEQAQGFQMMMDLGFSEDQISERTGFSKVTVKRRLKMAEMDPMLLKKACEAKDTERQITIADFEKLAQVDSIKERNALLKDIGSSGFGWSITRTLQRQKANAVRKQARKMLQDAGLKQIDEGKRYSSDYDRLWNDTVKLYEWKPGDPLIPKNKTDLFYLMDEDSVFFYRKCKKEPAQRTEKSQEEKEEDRKRNEAWENVKKDSEQARQMRREFADKMPINLKKLPDMMKHMITASVICNVDYCSISESIIDIFGLQDEHYSSTRVEKALAKLKTMPVNEWPKIIRCFYDADNRCNYYEGYQREMPHWKANPMLDSYYEWLTENGYQMSEMEIQMMSGTYPYFQKEGKKDEA